jgi:Bacterial protein of unknown function (DUF899)
MSIRRPLDRRRYVPGVTDRSEQEEIVMKATKIVSREEWLAARRILLVKEKELTRLQNAMRALGH